MALSDTQFEALRTQLKKKRETLGDTEYQAFLQRAATASESIPEQDNNGFAVDAAQGLAKSAGDTALGLGTLGRKVQRGLSKGVDAVFGTKGFGLSGNESALDEGSTRNIQAKKLLERDTAGEKVGGFVGDVAQYAIPGSAVAKGTKGLSFLKRATALAGSDAAVTVAKKGQVDRDALDAALLSVVFPGLGAAKNAAKPFLPSGKDAGGKVINSLVKPLLKDFAYGKNPGKAVAEAGITANTLDELAQKIGVERKKVGQEIGAIVAKSDKTFDVEDALSPIEEAITEAAKNPRTNAGIIRRLKDLQDDLLRITVDESDQAVIGRKLSGMNAQELFDLKVEVGELARWTGNASDDEIVNRALTKTYGKIKNSLDEAIPELKPLNDKYGNLKSAEIATTYRDKIAARQNLISLSGVQTGTAAALVSAIVSGGALAPILIGAGVAGLTQAGKTPAVKTRIASWLASASSKEKAEAFKKAPWLKGALQSLLLGEDADSEADQAQDDKED